MIDDQKTPARTLRHLRHAGEHCAMARTSAELTSKGETFAALMEVRRARTELAAAQEQLVHLLRDRGGSWQDVANAIGGSRQAAQQLYGTHTHA
jgi:hypothetical protein